MPPLIQLLRYCKLCFPAQPDPGLDQFQVAFLLDFLSYLEKELGNAPSTRNTRLAAVKSFFKMVGQRRSLFAEGFRRLCSSGKRPIVPHAMAAAIRDVSRDGLDSVHRIEEAMGRAGAGIGTDRNLDRSVMILLPSI